MGCGPSADQPSTKSENKPTVARANITNAEPESNTNQDPTRQREEEERIRQEEERKRLEEAKQKEDEAKKKQEEEEKRKQEEEEAKRIQEEKRRQEEERKKQEEIEQQTEEAEKKEKEVDVAPGGSLDIEYIEAAIVEHNRVRELHGAAPLTHSIELSNYAQKWAEHLSSTGQFAHSDCTMDGGKRVGENLAMGFQSTGAQLPAANAVMMWYDEIKDYEQYFGKEPEMKDFMKFGHFTQVVWQETKECGIGKCLKDGKTVVVGTYYPAGNMMGSFIENVNGVV